jgi:amphi-Trp domain-containing protein
VFGALRYAHADQASPDASLDSGDIEVQRIAGHDMAADEFKHESLQDLRSIGQYLKAITEGLESGRVELSDDNGQLALFPAGLLNLELRAKRRGNRAKLQLKLTWTEDKGKPLGPSLKVRPEPNS